MIIPYRGDFYSVQRFKLYGDLGQVLFIPFDIYDEEAIRKAVKYSNVVINLIGRQWETRNFSFQKVRLYFYFRNSVFYFCFHSSLVVLRCCLDSWSLSSQRFEPIVTALGVGPLALINWCRKYPFASFFNGGIRNVNGYLLLYFIIIGNK